MKVLRTKKEMRNLSEKWRKNGFKIGLVPTMGWFHEGHLALMNEAGMISDKIVASLFVNPIQFGPNEDFNSYPRDLERDIKLAEAQGVHALYHPSRKEMYPDGFQTSVHVDHLSKGLCGGKRPGHFDGVCTVVAKLLNQVQPHVAVFGEKDYQQLAVIRQMVNDLDIDVEIRGLAIVREPDGLAMSSRNTYLRKKHRQEALCLYEAIKYARECVKKNTALDLRSLENEIEKNINRMEHCEVDYVSIVDSHTLLSSQRVDEKSILILAVYLNDSIRLIDNGKLLIN